MAGAQARLLNKKFTEEGVLSDVRVMEDEVGEFDVECLCRNDDTADIGDTTGKFQRLVEKYGGQMMWALVRQTALGRM